MNKKNSSRYTELISIILNQQTPKIDYSKENNYCGFLLSEKADMIEAFLRFCHSDKKAIGLAANQVSYSGKRIDERFFAIKDFSNLSQWKLIVNPEIRSFNGEPEELYERCLTWPGKEIVAHRYPSVVISYQDISEREVENTILEGYEAQVWQHEIDHLNGVEENIFSKVSHRESPKIGRNDPCPCGSGSKYKKCCINK